MDFEVYNTKPSSRTWKLTLMSLTWPS